MRKSIIGLLGVLLLAVSVNAQTFTPIRVNCGGSAYTDSKGNIWAADNSFAGGVPYGQGGTYTITSTNDPLLFQSIRYAAQGGSFVYTFTVPNNNYVVNIGLAEIWGVHRKINILVNGVAAVSNLDALAKVGANTADFEAIPTTVTNGTLTIEVDSILSNGFISNIDIESATPPPPPPPPINLTAQGTFLFDDGSALAFGVTINVQQLNPTTGALINEGSITSDSTGNITGTFTIDPTLVDPNGFVTFQFSIAGVSGGINETLPLAIFQQGSTGIDLSLVLFRSIMLPKSFGAELLP